MDNIINVYSMTEEALAYLKSLPFAYPNVEVNGRKFYLVHGYYVENCLEQDVIDLEYINANLFSITRLEDISSALKMSL